MANLLIKAGSHYHRMPPLTTYPWVGSRSMSRRVTFAENAAYTLPDYNTDDVNKLFGMAFGLRGVHWNSIRFGWRWSRRLGQIELLAYAYTKGKRNWDEQLRFPVVAAVNIGQEVDCNIYYHEMKDGESEVPFFTLSVFDVATDKLLGMTRVDTVTLPPFGLTTGLYFGGMQPAPHNINILVLR